HITEDLPGMIQWDGLEYGPPEMGIDAAVAVAVVDHDNDRQAPPQLLGLQPVEVRRQVADPADLLVELPAGGKHDAVVGGHDLIAAPARDVDAVVERLPVH